MNGEGHGLVEPLAMSQPHIDKIPLFEALAPCKRILLAGAGGGFDIFSGLPLYFRLKSLGHEVWLANYSFTQLQYAKAVDENSPLVEVGPDTDGPSYFPEKYLAQWLNRNGGPPETIYTFKRTGVRPLNQAYQYLVDKLELDAVVLVDGGTDSLMRGDEDGLGSPTEDIASIAAVDMLDVPVKILTCIGFGVDTFHGICHHYFLEAVAALTRRGHFLGAFSLLPSFEEAELTQKVADFVFSRMPEHRSIVLSSILNSTQGLFGDHHDSQRTRGSELYLNPLMSLYWSFQVKGLAERCLYIDSLKETDSSLQVSQAILKFRGTVKARPWKEMPV